MTPLYLIARDETGKKNIEGSDPVCKYFLDELDVLEIVMAVEYDWNVEIEDELWERVFIDSVNTFDEVERLLKEELAIK